LRQRSTSFSRRRLSLLLPALLLAGCGQGDRVEGLISSIEDQGHGRAVAITVENDDGPHRILLPEDIDYGFDLKHLAEHRDQREPVSVKVQERNGRDVALKIEDA
jgi:hypothetical protein